MFYDHDDRRGERLLSYLEDLLIERGVEDAAASTIREELDTYVRKERCPQVAFDPARAVVSWIRQFDSLDDIPPTEEILERARRCYTGFDRVGKMVPGDGSFRPQPFDEPTPLEKETGRVSRTDAIQKTRAQMRVGEDAEEATVDRLVEETAESVEKAVETGTVATREAALERLTWPLPDDGVAIRRLEEACTTYLTDPDPTVLADGLHISRAWDGAGFDVLGLLFEDGELVPVRSEVKALADNAPASEPLRYRGRWRLLGSRRLVRPTT